MKMAVIPARGGSKRIPHKNIRSFCGKPIIAYSIEAALQSECFDHVMVSTDNGEIAEIARSYGAEIPFLRPSELADDHVGTLPVISQAIEWYQKQGENPEWICCIYATAPFIRAVDLCRGWQILQDRSAEYAFSVTTFPFPIQRAVKITSTGRLEMFYPEHFNSRSQDLEEAYHDAGQFYWGKSSAFLAQVPLFSEAAVPVLLPRSLVQDIDTPEDWERAELMFKAWYMIKAELG